MVTVVTVVQLAIERMLERPPPKPKALPRDCGKAARDRRYRQNQQRCDPIWTVPVPLPVPVIEVFLGWNWFTREIDADDRRIVGRLLGEKLVEAAFGNGRLGRDDEQ